jgi:glycosyltransferase involved in cell wall biosynthesis
LIALAAELGISQNVIMVGYLNGSGRAWRDAFRSADLFVMPSVSEPFGLTPFEALTYGSPILISKQSGVAEVLKNCLKVDFWDIDEMANKIVAVVENSGLRQELHNNGIKELAQLTWDPSISKLMDVYNQHLLAGATA